ncbi:MAG TPA: hypothetical protein PK014_11655 [Thermoanaerobaculia bacterium]|nr:hypothetical protein [Thermoanaerobaculia bacterium]HUM30777.1 hypothetical protein [Thermoanaerobaculia bacterium]HXK69023.1 hypothetical protein [Thermoanaerobaculia bacterium]
MGRRPRCHVPGGIYLVHLESVPERMLFQAPEEAYTFYQILEDGLNRFDHRIHAFCLMTGEVYLLCEIGRMPLSGIIQNVSLRYARYVNQNRKRRGRLFHGRYREVPVDPESTLLDYVIYVHLRPVEAGLVGNPIHFRWSSHRAYLGQDEVSWLSTTKTLSAIHPDPAAARALYLTELNRRSVAGFKREMEAWLPPAQPASPAQPPSRRVYEKLLQTLGNRLYPSETIDPGGRSRQADTVRACAAYVVRRVPALSLVGLGSCLSRSCGALSQSASRLERKLESKGGVQSILEDILEEYS